MKNSAKLWIGLLILMILTPLGLLAAGTAWGEWGTEEIKGLAGYVPRGLARLSDIWRAPLPGYSFRGLEKATFLKSSLAYIVSALLGVAIVVAIVYLLGRFLASKEEKNKEERES